MQLDSAAEVAETIRTHTLSQYPLPYIDWLRQTDAEILPQS